MPGSGSGAKRLHHMGITVSDLDRSLAFYSEAFGIEAAYEFEVDAEFAERVARVQAPCRGAMLELPNASLELLQYRTPDARPYSLRNCDVGAAHPCLEVDDIDAARERLAAMDVDCFTPPLPIEEGPLAGYRWFYFADPDGIVVELFQPPVS